MADDPTQDDDKTTDADDALENAADAPPIKSYSTPPDPEEEEQA